MSGGKATACETAGEKLRFAFARPHGIEPQRPPHRGPLDLASRRPPRPSSSRAAALAPVLRDRRVQAAAKHRWGKSHPGSPKGSTSMLP
eukprot:scaffold279218_cov30-Tisochrysis_lutea.AAC.3